MDWKRKWSPIGQNRNLDDDGFLLAGESMWEQTPNNYLIGTEDLKLIPCVVMLGEPGSGKSTEISIFGATNSSRLVLNLNEFSSELRLEKKLFESPQYSSWISGGTLEIVLDSLDECMIRIDSVTNMLAAGFSGIDPTRLKLRIACRTAVWPSSFETSLRKIWGSDSVLVTELQPLSRQDVVLAAVNSGLDSDIFSRGCSNRFRLPSVKAGNTEFFTEADGCRKHAPHDSSGIVRLGLSTAVRGN